MPGNARARRVAASETCLSDVKCYVGLSCRVWIRVTRNNSSSDWIRFDDSHQLLRLERTLIMSLKGAHSSYLYKHQELSDFLPVAPVQSTPTKSYPLLICSDLSLLDWRSLWAFVPGFRTIGPVREGWIKEGSPAYRVTTCWKET